MVKAVTHNLKFKTLRSQNCPKVKNEKLIICGSAALHWLMTHCAIVCWAAARGAGSAAAAGRVAAVTRGQFETLCCDSWWEWVDIEFSAGLSDGLPALFSRFLGYFNWLTEANSA